MPVCTGVPARAVALSGSSNYTICEPGFVPDGTKASCLACPAGLRQVGDGCMPCPINHIASEPGSFACSPCSPGSFASADAQSCEPCPVGTWRNASMTFCTPVPKRAAAMQGSSEYTMCSAGHVPDGIKATCVPLGAAQCTPCDPGYAASADQQSCDPCPYGTYRSANLSQCTPVPARAAAKQGSAVYEVCSNGTVPSAIRSDCVECRAGSYQLEDQCLSCPPNTITSDPGKDQCETCPEGYEAAADRQSCTPCLAGTYRHAPLLSCQRVPVGAAAPAASRNYTTCQLCDLGSYASEDSSECIPCTPGTFMAEGTQTCVRVRGNLKIPWRSPVP
eukprot:tig00000241_g21035.t1